MAATPAVKVVIAGDTKDLEKALKKSSGALGGFGKTALGVFGGIAIAKGVGLAVDGIQALGNFALEGVEKLDAFGDATARLDTLAKGLGQTATEADLTKFGVDKGEQADAALAIAKTGKALGLTGKEVAGITPDLQKMAAQLASLGDGDPVKQSELLAKALAGNAKAAKALGIQLPKGATGLEAYAAIAAQLGPQLDKATSGQASLADVGDRWDATLANLQLQLAGFLDKLAPVISQLLDALLPALQKLVDDVGPLVAVLFENLAGALQGFVEGGGAQEVAAIFSTIASVVGKLAGFIVENVLPTILELAAAIATNLQPILPPLMEAFDALLPILERVWGFVQDVVVPLLVNFLLPVISKILTVIIKLAGAFLRVLGPAIDDISKAFDDLLDFLQPVLDVLGDILGAAGGALDVLSDLPFLSSAPASASAITRAGGTVAGIRAGGGTTVVVNAGVGDPVAIGRMVAKYLGAYQLRGGTV